MLYIHPCFQAMAILLVIYVLYLGVQRFLSGHFHKKVPFKWKRHVLLGKIALVALLAGMFGGISMVYIHWHHFLISGIHAFVGLILAPLIVIGFSTGLYLDAKKGKHGDLALIHGINNLIIFFLCISQIITGIKIL
ncbi:MAG: DUF4079 family protein [Deltaproteobacteria bacterium]|nr:DUF4079 family protein [Deltaproteobacteria bacterium]